MVNNTISLNKLFSAIADPTRRMIIDKLAEHEQTVTQVAKPFSMSLPAVLKHVRVLEESGLVVRRKEGRMVYCKLNKEPLEQAMNWFAFYEKFWNARLDNLGRHLVNKKIKKHGKPR